LLRIEVDEDRKITGIVFSDLGQAASFMALEWVQKILQQKVGFAPYAGTLNLRLTSPRGIARWKELKQVMRGVDIAPPDPSICRARCYPARIETARENIEGGGRVAVLVPEVKDYPADKLEIIAPFHVKNSLGIDDGHTLTLELIGD
jgi:riboflavin kinase, archaea type